MKPSSCSSGVCSYEERRRARSMTTRRSMANSHPRSVPSSSSKRRPRAPGAHEGLLHRFLGQAMVVERAAGEAEELAAMGEERLAQAFGVGRLARPRGLGVRGRRDPRRAGGGNLAAPRRRHGPAGDAPRDPALVPGRAHRCRHHRSRRAAPRSGWTAAGSDGPAGRAAGLVGSSGGRENVSTPRTWSSWRRTSTRSRPAPAPPTDTTYQTCSIPWPLSVRLLRVAGEEVERVALVRHLESCPPDGAPSRASRPHGRRAWAAARSGR